MHPLYLWDTLHEIELMTTEWIERKTKTKLEKTINKQKTTTTLKDKGCCVFC